MKKLFEEYQNGVKIRTVEIEISDAEAERDAAADELKKSLKRLRQIAQRSQAIADAGTGPNNNQMRTLAGDVADLAQTLRRLLTQQYDEDAAAEGR